MNNMKLLLPALMVLSSHSLVNGQCPISGQCWNRQQNALINGGIFSDANGSISMHMRNAVQPESRIMGQAFGNDSLVVNYASTGEGYINRSGLQSGFDDAYIYHYNPATSNWEIKAYGAQAFDAAGRLTATIGQVWQAATGYYLNSTQELYSWTEDNLQSYVYQTWNEAGAEWKNADEYTYTYDGANNIIAEVHRKWDAAGNEWVNDYQYTYSYIANNKVSVETDQVWDKNRGVWINQLQYAYAYDGSDNNVLSQVTNSWNAGSGSWDAKFQTINTYDGYNNQLTSLQQQWTGGAWVNQSLYVYNDFTSQLPQTETYQLWDASAGVFRNDRKYTYSYNANNQLIDQASQTWTSSGAWQRTNADQESRTYYATNTTDVNASIAQGGTVLLYPVPAKDKLHMNVQWDVAQPFTVSLYDIRGIVIDKWDVPATAQYYNELPLNLPTGNYFVRFTGMDGGNIVQQILVSK